MASRDEKKLILEQSDIFSEVVSVSLGEPAAFECDCIELCGSSVPYSLLPPSMIEDEDAFQVDMREAPLCLSKDVCHDIYFVSHKPKVV